jgi:tetratricopeptide (TPR) repeat protein
VPLDRKDPRRDRDPQTLVEEATLDFTLGDLTAALGKIHDALIADINFFPGYHALSEIYFSTGDLPMALAAATKAHKLRPDDVHINTSLSRIYMELGEKEQAEHYGAQARMLGWKAELKEPPPSGTPGPA